MRRQEVRLVSVANPDVVRRLPFLLGAVAVGAVAVALQPLASRQRCGPLDGMSVKVDDSLRLAAWLADGPHVVAARWPNGAPYRVCQLPVGPGQVPACLVRAGDVVVWDSGARTLLFSGPTGIKRVPLGAAIRQEEYVAALSASGPDVVANLREDTPPHGRVLLVDPTTGRAHVLRNATTAHGSESIPALAVETSAGGLSVRDIAIEATMRHTGLAWEWDYSVEAGVLLYVAKRRTVVLRLDAVDMKRVKLPPSDMVLLDRHAPLAWLALMGPLDSGSEVQAYTLSGRKAAVFREASRRAWPLGLVTEQHLRWLAAVGGDTSR